MSLLAAHDLNSGLTAAGWSTAGSPVAETTVTKAGAGSMLVTPSGSQELINTAKISPIGTNDSFVRFYFRMSAAPSAAFMIFGTFNTVSCYIRLNTARTLQVMSGATAKAAGATVLATNTWYCIEARMRCGAASGAGEFEVRLDGVSEIATQTSMAMGTGAYGFYFGCVAAATSTGNFYFDEIQVNSNAGASDNSWVGLLSAASNQTIQVARIDTTPELYSPAVVPGVLTVAPDRINTTVALRAPSVVPGTLTVAAARIENAAAMASPMIVPGAISREVHPLMATPELYAPIVVPGPLAVAPARIEATSQLFAPTVTVDDGSTVVRPERISAASELFAPSIVQEYVMPAERWGASV